MNTDRVAEEVGKMIRALPFREHASVARIYKATLIAPGAIAARLDAIEKGKVSIEGVAVGRVNGVLGAWNTDPESVRKAFNDPTVKCCGRDVADCDCTELAKMFAEAKALHGDNADEVEDMAREVAISLIVDGGYETSDSDLNGDPMGDTVQSLLMIAVMRQPLVVNGWRDKGYISCIA